MRQNGRRLPRHARPRWPAASCGSAPGAGLFRQLQGQQQQQAQHQDGREDQLGLAPEC